MLEPVGCISLSLWSSFFVKNTNNSNSNFSFGGKKIQAFEPKHLEKSLRS